MLDNLLIDLGIKDRAKVQTVSDLIGVLRDSYNSGTQYTKREMYYGVQDDKIILLMSPCFRYVELKGTFFIYLDKFEDKRIIKMPNGEDMCAVSLDLRNNYSFLSDIESRWIQYFTICYCVFIIGCKPKYCDLNSTTWYKTKQPADIQFTLRDSIKALQT